jgi:hypothetical protein
MEDKTNCARYFEDLSHGIAGNLPCLSAESDRLFQGPTNIIPESRLVLASPDL